jgi:nucleoid-associated protein YgaU
MRSCLIAVCGGVLLVVAGCQQPGSQPEPLAATPRTSEPRPPITLDALEPDGKVELAGAVERPARAAPPPVSEPDQPPPGDVPVDERLSPTTGDVPVTYVVEAGDTLIKIARKVYNNESRWRDIYAANRHQLAQPGLIRVGMRLELPPP